MTTKTTYEPVFVFTPAPQAERLDVAESFVIGGIRYTVEPDVTKKVVGGKDGRFYFNASKGFAGRQFVIETFDGRRIVTRNLWEGEPVEDPDTAVFVGSVPGTVSLANGYRPDYLKGTDRYA